MKIGLCSKVPSRDLFLRDIRPHARPFPSKNKVKVKLLTILSYGKKEHQEPLVSRPIQNWQTDRFSSCLLCSGVEINSLYQFYGRIALDSEHLTAV